MSLHCTASRNDAVFNFVTNPPPRSSNEVSCKEASTGSFNIPVGRARKRSGSTGAASQLSTSPFRAVLLTRPGLKAETERWLQHRLQKRHLARLKITLSCPTAPWTTALPSPRKLWATSASSSVTTINAMKSSVSPIIVAIPTAFRKLPRRPRPATSFSAASTSWPKAPTSWRARAKPFCFPISTPAAPWPIWLRSRRWKTPGSSSWASASPTTTATALRPSPT